MCCKGCPNNTGSGLFWLKRLIIELGKNKTVIKRGPKNCARNIFSFRKCLQEVVPTTLIQEKCISTKFQIQWHLGFEKFFFLADWHMQIDIWDYSTHYVGILTKLDNEWSNYSPANLSTGRTIIFLAGR